MQLFALYVVAHGHHSPGGGFQGGVILGASLILLAMSTNIQTVLKTFSDTQLLNSYPYHKQKFFYFQIQHIPKKLNKLKRCFMESISIIISLTLMIFGYVTTVRYKHLTQLIMKLSFCLIVIMHMARNINLQMISFSLIFFLIV